MYKSANDIELRLRALISHTNAGVVQVDASGRMTLVNERWCEMLGYTEPELLGMLLADVTAPNSLGETRRALEALAAGGPPVVIQKNYRRKDGTALAASSSVSALRTDDGQYAGLVAIVWNVGENGQAEEALRLSEQQLRARDSDLEVLEIALRKADEFLVVVTDTIPNLISYVDRDFRFPICNVRIPNGSVCPGNVCWGRPSGQLSASVHGRRLPRICRRSSPAITSGHIALRRRTELLSDLVRDAVEGHQAALARGRRVSRHRLAGRHLRPRGRPMAGAEVRTAYGGEDALQVGRTFRPDAVLLDVGMPRQQRTEPVGARCPRRGTHRVGATPRPAAGDDAGFDGHLTKPADPGVIQRLLADLPARRSHA